MNVINDVIKKLQELYPEAVINEEVVTKNNGFERRAISFKKDKDSQISKLVYVDELENMSVDDIVLEVFGIINSKEPIDIVKNIQNFDDAKSHLTVELINKECNAEALKSLIYEDLLDLALVAVLVYKSENGDKAAVKVSKDMCGFWDVSENDILETAKNNMFNTKASICDMNTFLTKLGGEEYAHMVPIPMYILSNKDYYFGAAKIADDVAMEEISLTLESDILVIPSSIHECILLPFFNNSKENLKLNEIIQSVNLTTVKANEVLSNHAYLYKIGEGLSEFWPTL